MGNRNRKGNEQRYRMADFPSSSDEEDYVLPIPRESFNPSRQHPRTSVDEMPGTSGINSVQPTTLEETSPAAILARKNQAKLDRNFFWSIINHTPTPTENQASRRRQDQIISVKRVTIRPSEEPLDSSEARRLLEFKNLTRSLQNLEHSLSTGNTAQPSAPYAVPHAVPRGFWDSVFNDAVEVQPDPPQSGEEALQQYYDYAMGQMRRASLINLRSRGTVNVENMDIGSTINVSDEPVRNAPVMAPNSDFEENIEDLEGEIAEADLSRHNTSSAGLMEEVMEVAPSNETENLEPPSTEANEALDEPTSENTTNVASVAAELLAGGNAQQTKEKSSSHQGLKRKRDSLGDRKEPFSVQDFNQKLLTLLECPVCLEWMEPPIAQCRRGHLVCARCRARLNACPVCRTPFSSVRNRAMEGVAEMLRYPCRHGCGRDVKLRRRTPHESSCASRRYQCPAPECTRHTPLPRDELAHHFQCKHLPILKIGRKHKFSMRVNAEQHDTWLIMAMDEYFHLQVDVDIRTWGVVVYVSYIGPKKNADSYYYEVTVQGQHSSRKLVYTRTTHSDLESPSVNVSRQDCFHLTLDQALNFLRVRNKYCQPDKYLDFDVELSKLEVVDDSMEESDDDSPLVDESPEFNSQDD